MKEYEGVFIIVNREDRITDTVNKIKQIISEKSGNKIVSEDPWGKRLMAFPIKKMKEGYYLLLNLTLEQNTIPEMRNELRLNENIIRFAFFRKEL